MNLHMRRFMDFVLAPLLIYGLIAAMTEAHKLNPIFYLVLISVSCGVSVAFIPNVREFFRADRPLTGRGAIAWGIFVAWLFDVYRPAIFTAIALFPQLSWLRDSDILSFGIALSIYAAIMHLVSPAIEDGRLPSATWALIGALVGACVLAGLTAINWSEIRSIWEGHSFARPAVYRPAVDGAPAGCRSTLRDG